MIAPEYTTKCLTCKMFIAFPEAVCYPHTKEGD